MNTILLLSLSAVLLLNVLCQNCDDTAKPNTLSDCEKLITKEGGTCCFAQSPGFYAFEKKCVEIDEYREQREYWDGMERWRLECPSKGYEKKKYQLCGADYPMDAIDCWKYSTPKQSCCYTNKTEPWCYGNKSDQLIKKKPQNVDGIRKIKVILLTKMIKILNKSIDVHVLSFQYRFPSLAYYLYF